MAVRVWKERKIANGDEWDAIIIDVGGVSIPSDLFEHWFPEAERPRAESPRAEAGTKEVDEDPNSEPQSRILGSQQKQYQMSEEMQIFLSIPKRVDDNEVVDDTTTRETTPVPKLVSPSQESSQEPTVCQIRLTYPSYLDLESDDEDKMSVDSNPERQAIEDAVEKARPVLETLRLKAGRQQSLSSKPVIAKPAQSGDDSKKDDPEQDPTTIWVRGRPWDVNEFMNRRNPDWGN